MASIEGRVEQHEINKLQHFKVRQGDFQLLLDESSWGIQLYKEVLAK